MDTFELSNTTCKIYVARKDFPKLLTWDEAKKACSDLGEDWRLPTKEELYEIYLMQDEIGGFHLNGAYWSSTYFESDFTSYWYQYISLGDQYPSDKDEKYYVRAVRTIL